MRFRRRGTPSLRPATASVRGATLLLAQVEWRAGRRDGMRKHMDDASEFVAGMPPSRIQAAVLCEASRYEMLADRSDRAVELGREALRLAAELGLDDIRAKALINVGTARAGAGQPEGFHDLEAGKSRREPPSPATSRVHVA